MIELITFDLSGCHEHERAAERIVWGKAGDILSLDVVPSPWRTFKPMERESWLDDARRMARPGGIVSLDPQSVDSWSAIQIVYKRAHGSGWVHTGILVVEFRQHWCQFTVVCGEHGTTGIREALVTDQLLRSGRIRFESIPFTSDHSSAHRGTWRVGSRILMTQSIEA